VLKVVAIQYNPVFLDLKANRTKVGKLIEKIMPKKDPTLIVLPELAFSGYNFEALTQVKQTAETIPASESCRLLEKLASEHGVYLVAGINEKEEEHYYNSAVIFGPKGYIMTYRKLHLYAQEKIFFSAGNLPLQTFNLENYKVGVMICFDWFFPEVPRTLALLGADIVCHPMNAVIPDGAYIGDSYHARWSRMFLVLANRIGEEQDLKFIGRSTIIDPTGKVLAQAAPDTEEIISAVIDPLLARNKELNKFNHLLNDRRPNFYKCD
jgi:predicted amidohydrolase